MSKNAKKNQRRLALLRLRASFLGIENTDKMGIKQLSSRINLIIGAQKFLTYVTLAGYSQKWADFRSSYEKKSRSLARILRKADTDVEISRDNHRSQQDLFS